MLQFLEWKLLGHMSATERSEMLLSRVKSIYPFKPFHACQSPYSSGFRVAKTVYMTSSPAAQRGVPGAYHQPRELVRNTEFQPLPSQTYHFRICVLMRSFDASSEHPGLRNPAEATGLFLEQCEKYRSGFWFSHFQGFLYRILTYFLRALEPLLFCTLPEW